MRKVIVLFVCLTISLITNAQLFFEDFNEGIPSTFKVYDEDKLTPNQSMTGLGFSVGKSWLSYSLKDEQQKFAASTSQYEVEGTSNDWLVTPGIDITSTGVYLEWKAISCSKTSKPGYKVFISTIGNEIKDFTETLVYEVTEEESEWTEHHVSLEKYVGKKIYVAYVNNSTNKFLLGIDDIKVYAPNNIQNIISTTPVTVSSVPDFVVSAKLYANYVQPIHAFTASYICGDKTVTQEFKNLTIQPNEEYEFVFDERLKTSLGDTTHYSVQVKIGEEKHDAVGYTVCYAFTPNRISVIEEATGSWCAWCTGGHMAMDYMREHYGKECIRIAVHNGDPMTINAYDNGLYALGVKGYPTGFINRKYQAAPLGINLTPADGGFETYYLKAKQELTPFDLDLEVSYDDTKAEFCFKGAARSALNLTAAKYNLAFIIKECNVRGNTVKYNQYNAYANNDREVGGFESLPAIIPASIMVYHDVARTIKPYFKGQVYIDGSVRANEEINYEYAMPVPGTIMNTENLSFIVLLLEPATNEIMNAREFRLNDHDHEHIGPSGIQEQTQDSPEIFISTSQEECLVVVSTKAAATSVEAELYDMEGKLLLRQESKSYDNRHEFRLDSNGLKGGYILKFSIDGVQFTRKIVF